MRTEASIILLHTGGAHLGIDVTPHATPKKEGDSLTYKETDDQAPIDSYCGQENLVWTRNCAMAVVTTKTDSSKLCHTTIRTYACEAKRTSIVAL